VRKSEIRGIICLEGPDAVGKTTLARAFKDEWGAKVIHATYRFKKRMPAYQAALFFKALEYSRDNLVILDRHWISECVYSAVYRGGHKWPETTFRWDRLFERFGVLTVLCLPESVEAAIRRHRENLDPDHPYDDATFAQVTERYLDLWHGNIFNDGMDWVGKLSRQGGVNERLDFVRYRIVEEGRDIKSFMTYCLKRARDLRQIESRRELTVRRPK
jgi:thymidylate kinase